MKSKEFAEIIGRSIAKGFEDGLKGVTMEPKNLSKQKYIYKVYRAKDNRYHIEKFPIIYANKSIVYFKENGPYLSSERFDTVFDYYDSTNMDRVNRKLTYGHYVCFWNEPVDIEQYFKEIMKHKLKERFERCEEMICEYRDAIKRYEQEMVDIALELEALE